MSEILNKLKELVNYYKVNRQVGHTFRMLNGVLSNVKYTTPNNNGHETRSGKVVILTHNHDMNRNIKEIVNELSTDEQEVIYISLNSNNYDKVLRRHHAPLLIDNCLLQQLFQEAATEIETLNGHCQRLFQDSRVKVETLEADLKTLSTDANRYKQDNITLEHFNKKLTDDLAISLSIQYKLDERIEKLEAEKKELIDTLVKVKNELLTYRENESDKDTSQTINRELLTSVRELNEKIDSERRVVDLVGEYKTSQKSFLSPLVDMLIENREVKSIEVKIEYKE